LLADGSVHYEQRLINRLPAQPHYDQPDLKISRVADYTVSKQHVTATTTTIKNINNKEKLYHNVTFLLSVKSTVLLFRKKQSYCSTPL